MSAVTPLNNPNNTKNFAPADNFWTLLEFPVKEGVVIEDGTLLAIEVVANTTTGKLVAAGAENANGSDIVGILAEPVRSTDDDYNKVFKTKGVYVPTSTYAQAFFTVGAGTFTQADVFKTVEVNGTGKTLAVDTPGKGARITGFISATKGLCALALPSTETA